MHILCISSFPPKECGVAEFHQSLMHELQQVKGVHISSVALNEGDTLVRGYPADVRQQIRLHMWEDYQRAIEYINHSTADFVLIEHEFSLFGGYSGTYAIPFIQQLRKPVVMVAHTVPVAADVKKPVHKKQFFQQTYPCVKLFIVTLKKAKDVLVSYGIPANSIVVIDHGAPDIYSYKKQDIRSLVSIPQSQKIAFSFGFAHPVKGYDLAIRAMARIQKKQLPVHYVYVYTYKHRADKIAYVNYLHTLVKHHHLGNNVTLLERYINNTDLYGLLQSVDLGIVPYQMKNYPSSGVLSYFIAAKKPVVVTPIAHATYLLPNKQKYFAPIHSVKGIANQIERIVQDDAFRNEMTDDFSQIADRIVWKRIAKEYIKVFQRLQG